MLCFFVRFADSVMQPLALSSSVRYRPISHHLSHRPCTHSDSSALSHSSMRSLSQLWHEGQLLDSSGLVLARVDAANAMAAKGEGGIDSGEAAAAAAQLASPHCRGLPGGREVGGEPQKHPL